jgi:hypothetical protein
MADEEVKEENIVVVVMLRQLERGVVRNCPLLPNEDERDASKGQNMDRKVEQCHD